MPHQIRPLKDLHKLPLKLKRDDVQITKAGGFYKARLAGRADFVFASTPEEARNRLLGSEATSYRDSRHAVKLRKKFERLKNHEQTNPIGHKARSIAQVVCVFARGATPKGDAQAA